LYHLDNLSYEEELVLELWRHLQGEDLRGRGQVGEGDRQRRRAGQWLPKKAVTSRTISTYGLHVEPGFKEPKLDLEYVRFSRLVTSVHWTHRRP
jgi:hypothetical protein